MTDPQNDTTEPLCERLNYTMEPEAGMCSMCQVNCPDRVTNFDPDEDGIDYDQLAEDREVAKERQWEHVRSRL